MDKEQGEFGALRQAGSLTEDDAVLLKSPKIEKPDEQDEDEEILAMLKEEKMIIEQDLNIKPCLLTNIKSISDTMYNENLITYCKISEQLENEIPEKISDLESRASDGAVLLNSPKIEKPDEEGKEEEILAMLKEEKMIIEQELNIRPCFLINNKSTAETLYSENLVTNFKTLEWIESETPEQIPDLGSNASDDAMLLKSPKVEIPDEQDKEKEILAMLEEEELIMKQDLIKTCFSTDSESTAEMQYCQNVFKKSKTLERIETPNIRNKASGADTGMFSTPTLPHGVRFEPDNKFICNDCGQQFSRKPPLIQHIKSHNTTSKGNFNCQECDYRTHTRDTLERHLRLHDKTLPHQCDICGRTFSRNNNLQQHRKFQHSVDKEQLYSCDVCVYKTSRISDLKKHARTHLEEKQKGVVKGKVQVHTGEKPFSCSICGHKFTQNCHLSRHMKLHTGEKPFSCHICPYQSSRKCSLKIHLRSHTEEKPFSCPTCGYKFTQHINLKRHMRVHTGEKPFACQMCTYRCTQRQDLKSHMRIHTGEKPFSCHLCTFQCSNRNCLKTHMRNHT